MHRRIDLVLFFSFLALGILIYWPVFGLRPLDAENGYILWWAHTTPFESLFRLDPYFYPEWRPLPFQSIWLEHLLVPLDAIAIHFAINLLITVSCAWLVYRISVLLSGSRPAGVMAAILLLVDRRARFSIVWIVERQTSLACAFGLLATFLVLRAGDRRLARRDVLIIAGLLLAAALSKEFGLAFAFSLITWAVWRRRADEAAPAMAAVAAYAALRLALAGGALGSYAVRMGYFFETEYKSVLPSGAGQLAQAAYNVIAAAIAIPLRGVVTETGAINLDGVRLAASLGFGVFALIALKTGDRALRLVAVIAMFNSALSIAFYRGRNVVIGLAAVNILIGIGIALSPRLRHPHVSHRIRTAIIVLGVALLCRRAIHTHRIVSQEVRDWNNNDLCDTFIRERPGGGEFISYVKRFYGLQNPSCSASD